MTEQEYIDRGNLVSITHAISILRHVTPEASSIIDKKRYKEMMLALTQWQIALHSFLMIDED